MQAVANIIGCSDKTIYSWVETGYLDIPYIKFGDKKKSLVRFEEDKIREWIKKQAAATMGNAA